MDHLLHWPDLTRDRTFDDIGEGAAHAPGEPALQLLLMPERAVLEPLSRTLFVADVHLGKDAVFRARGLPVPQGSTEASLERLSHALDRSGAERLVVLGDFLHAKESLGDTTLKALRSWRDWHHRLDCTVVEGNHDVHAGQLHSSFGMRTLRGMYEAGPLRGVHDPGDAADLPGTLTLAGHVHPVVRLSSRLDSLRLPCFWLHQGVLTLPAFGEFTGGWPIDRRADANDVFFVVSDRVSRLPPLG